MSDHTNADFSDVINGYPENIQRIVKRVLKLEAERLYQERPHLNEDIAEIVKEETADEADTAQSP